MPWHVPTAMSAFLKLVTLPDGSASRVLLGQDAPLRWIEIIGSRTERDMPWHVPTAMSAFLKLVTLPDGSASRVLLGQDAPLRWIEIIGSRTEIFNKPERV